MLKSAVRCGKINGEAYEFEFTAAHSHGALFPMMTECFWIWWFKGVGKEKSVCNSIRSMIFRSSKEESFNLLWPREVRWIPNKSYGDYIFLLSSFLLCRFSVVEYLCMNKRLECTVNGTLIMFLQVLTINPLSLSCQPCSMFKWRSSVLYWFGVWSNESELYFLHACESTWIFFCIFPSRSLKFLGVMQIGVLLELWFCICTELHVYLKIPHQHKYVSIEAQKIDPCPHVNFNFTLFSVVSSSREAHCTRHTIGLQGKHQGWL